VWAHFQPCKLFLECSGKNKFPQKKRKKATKGCCLCSRDQQSDRTYVQSEISPRRHPRIGQWYVRSHYFITIGHCLLIRNLGIQVALRKVEERINSYAMWSIGIILSQYKTISEVCQHEKKRLFYQSWHRMQIQLIAYSCTPEKQERVHCNCLGNHQALWRWYTSARKQGKLVGYWEFGEPSKHSIVKIYLCGCSSRYL